MRTKSHNVEILMGSETNDIIKELFESLLQKYQEGLIEKMRESELVFDSVDLLYYQLHKISLKRPREMYNGGVLGQFCAYKNHTKISREYFAIKRWLRCRDTLNIQK